MMPAGMLIECHRSPVCAAAWFGGAVGFE